MKPTIAPADDEDGPQNCLWPTTMWTEIANPDRTPDDLDELIRRYLKPLRVWLMFRFPTLKGEADALVIEFIEDRMIKEGWLSKADRNRGRFRYLLQRSFHNYVLDNLKRRKPDEPLPDLEGAEAGSHVDEEFEVAWVGAILGEVLARMEAECSKTVGDKSQKWKIWQIFKIMLVCPMLDGAETPPYAEVVESLSLKSPAEGYNMLNTGKRIFARLLEEEIARYEGATRVDIELEELKRLLERIAKRKRRRK
jgi:hypothetical protein